MRYMRIERPTAATLLLALALPLPFTTVAILCHKKHSGFFLIRDYWSTDSTETVENAPSIHSCINNMSFLSDPFFLWWQLNNLALIILTSIIHR
jgi:hypothetical protein